MKAYEFHTAENRPALFAALPRKVWLETDLARTWIIADPDVCAAILRHPAATLPNLLAIVNFVEQARGIALPNMHLACDYFPPLLDGDAHARARKIIARYLAERLEALEGELPAIIERGIAGLSQPGGIDLYRDVVRAIVADVGSILVQRQLTDEITDLRLSDVFPLNKSATRLLEIDAEIARALAFVTRPGDDPDLIACKVSCLAFGMDSLAMLLTEGMLAALRAPAPHHLPEHPVETGVPVTYRMAAEDFSVGPHSFRAGDLIRLQLQPFGYAKDAAVQTLMFGAGMHSCVGKQISLRVWAQLRAQFNALSVMARHIHTEHERSHFIALYKSVKIEVLT